MAETLWQLEHPHRASASGRTRLRRMNDDALNRFGQAARYMCSPAANLGKEPRRVFVIQLREAVEEWRRRHRETNINNTRLRQM